MDPRVLVASNSITSSLNQTAHSKHNNQHRQQQGKENQAHPHHHYQQYAPPLIPLPSTSNLSESQVVRYSHPHSPNPTNFSPRTAQLATCASPTTPTTPHAPMYGSQLSSPTMTQFNATAFAPPPSSYSSPQRTGHNNQQHYSRPLGSAHNSNIVMEPTMEQLLANQSRPMTGYNSRDMRDVTMASGTEAAGLVSWRKGQGFKEWEKQKFNSTEVKRKADVAQLYFYDHYFDLLNYLHARKQRLSNFKHSVAERGLAQEEASNEWRSYCGRERVLLRKRRTKLKLDAFHILVQVGQGGYGEVFLARHKETNQVCALKKMKKKTLAKMDEIRHVLTERDILASTKSPWLVRLLFAFQDPTYVYLAMDFVPGGDFRTLLNNSGVLKEEHAQFYISEMFSAVAELHKLGYIHRDLKPENFLIDATGHIKLTDFGLAAGALNPGKIEHMKHKLDDVKDGDLIFRSTVEMKSIYKTLRMTDARYADSIVGSPDYMAIECLRGQSYSYSVDYWSLGCVLFEFLCGFPPFSGATSDETWANLKNWSRVLRRPHYDRPEDQIFNLSDVGWSAIASLINTKEKRISTMDQLKAHPFFNGVNWDGLRDEKAPFIPSLDSEIDAGYFDDFTNEADMAKYAEVKAKQDQVDRVREKDEKFGRGVWVGFTFKAKVKEQIVEPTAHHDGDDELVVLF